MGKKIAIITGASSGMGRECAIQLADRFAGLQEIWLIARRKERLEELSCELPHPVRIFPFDLSLDGDYASLKEALEIEKPEVKWLVNAAGFGQIGMVDELSLEQSAKMVTVNCRSLVEMTQLVLPYLSNNSRILQFASAAAFLPQPRFAVYAATKSFVLSYTRALTMELAHRKISVTAVCPGPVKTEFFDLAEQTGKIALYKRLVMADPRKVVSLAIRDCMMGKSVSVYGITMKAFQVLTKLVPHSLLLQVFRYFMQSPAGSVKDDHIKTRKRARKTKRERQLNIQK